MTHGSQSAVASNSVAARRQGLIAAVLLLTAGLPGGSLAYGPASTDAATVSIRVSVAPVYGLTRASHDPYLGDTEAKLCVRTNATLPTLPVTGEWLGGDRPDFKIVLPSCGGLLSPTALAQVMEYHPSGQRLLLISPE